MSTAVERVGERAGIRLRRRSRAPRPEGRSLSDVRLRDLGQGLARLGPFLAAAGAGILLVAVPPTGHGALQAASAGVAKKFQLPLPPGSSDQAGGGTATAATPPPAAAVPASDASAAPLGPAPAVSYSSPPPSAAAASPPAAAATDSSSAAAAPAADTPTADQTAATPLTVAAKAWASREAGTPLASDGVPDGALPVGNRVGQADKASFVRLSGTATTLNLTVDPSGDRSLAGAGAVQACPITAQWTPSDAMSFDQAPAYDSTKCVPGTQPYAGSWSFDLSGFADRAQGNGFALVPAPSAPVDFQVAFKAG